MSGPGGVSARALRYWETRQAAASNNLANVSTPGFKAERVFAKLLSEAELTTASGTDFSAGAVSPTGRPLDIAVVGDGFLVTETPAGRRWMRGGALTLDSEGALVDSSGRNVLGAGGPIVVPPGEIEITNQGEIRVDGKTVGQLLLERPSEDGPLEREGANLWIPPKDQEAVPTAEVQVRQGHLEESNVDPVGALVEMIEIQRAYAAVQRSMLAEDGVMRTITTQIGRIG
jgi:flagellar basal-body rod protein FlgF